MWGVRRRDAARHNESGWLIRPEMRSCPSPFVYFYFIFILHLGLSAIFPVLVRAGQKEKTFICGPADPSGPGREHFWGMAPVVHLMTWSIAAPPNSERWQG